MRRELCGLLPLLLLRVHGDPGHPALPAPHPRPPGHHLLHPHPQVEARRGQRGPDHRLQRGVDRAGQGDPQPNGGGPKEDHLGAPEAGYQLHRQGPGCQRQGEGAIEFLTEGILC